MDPKVAPAYLSLQTPLLDPKPPPVTQSSIFVQLAPSSLHSCQAMEVLKNFEDLCNAVG